LIRDVFQQNKSIIKLTPLIPYYLINNTPQYRIRKIQTQAVYYTIRLNRGQLMMMVGDDVVKPIVYVIINIWAGDSDTAMFVCFRVCKNNTKSKRKERETVRPDEIIRRVRRRRVSRKVQYMYTVY